MVGLLSDCQSSNALSIVIQELMFGAIYDLLSFTQKCEKRLRLVPNLTFPLYQHIRDRIAGLTILAGMFFPSFVGIKRLVTRFRQHENAVTKA